MLNPTLVAEVLSDCAEGYDRGKKAEHYRQIRSLRGYLLVGQKAPHVELFARLGKQWVLREASGLGATIELPSLNITLALSEIYANVKLL